MMRSNGHCLQQGLQAIIKKIYQARMMRTVIIRRWCIRVPAGRKNNYKQAFITMAVLNIMPATH